MAQQEQSGRVTVLDGGLGHMLKARGEGCTFLAGALANAQKPEAVREAHKEFIDAGAPRGRAAAAAALFGPASERRPQHGACPLVVCACVSLFQRCEASQLSPAGPATAARLPAPPPATWQALTSSPPTPSAARAGRWAR